MDQYTVETVRGRMELLSGKQNIDLRTALRLTLEEMESPSATQVRILCQATGSAVFVARRTEKGWEAR